MNQHWHRDWPNTVSPEIHSLVAKALMLRLGGSVNLSMAELNDAADTQAEMRLLPGGMDFRVERQ